MTEHTPTTAEVRERFIDGFPMDTWAVSREECGREFDRWLAKVRAEAWDEGYRTCDQAWAETWDITTPDEYRTDPRNPYRTTEGEKR